MMHDPEFRLQEIHRHALEEQREAAMAKRYRHSRSRLLAGFLRTIADRIDPTGQERKDRSWV